MTLVELIVLLLLLVYFYKIQPEYGDEQADAGRDCRTPLAKTKFSGANADREIFIFAVQLTTCRIGNLTRFPDGSNIGSTL